MLYMIKNRGGGGGEEICKMKSSRRSASNFTLPPPPVIWIVFLYFCSCTDSIFLVVRQWANHVAGCQPIHICDVSKPSANVWNIFQASTGDFPVTSGGGRNVKFTCEGAKQYIFVMFPSPQPMYVRVPNTGFFWFLQCFQDFPSPQHMFGIYFRLVLVIFCYKRGGGNVKLICEGTNQCIFVMFPSPQPMFGIYFRLVLVIFLLQEGGEKCKIDMSGYQTMHICDVLKPSANVWNISG